MLHSRAMSLAIPSPTKGHRHRRSAAISLDWRHVQLPSVEHVSAASTPAPAPMIPAGSPTLTFASTISDCSIDAGERIVASTQVSTRSTSPVKRRVAFVDAVQEIEPRESGDTWMKPEDYSWHIQSADESETVVLQALEASSDLAPPSKASGVPGSPTLTHRKKRSTFLQSTRNALTRRPSKKRPISPTEALLTTMIPAPSTNVIDLDLALSPAAPKLQHKKSGSLSTTLSVLPASPTKPNQGHRRSESAPADVIFSFSPRPASPDSRKRKMCAIVENPSSPVAAEITDQVNTVADLKSRPRKSGLQHDIPDDMIFGEPGEMVSTFANANSESPAIASLTTCRSSSTITRKGWKGVLHRLLH